jgi:hypothetical protein
MAQPNQIHGHSKLDPPSTDRSCYSCLPIVMPARRTAGKRNLDEGEHGRDSPNTELATIYGEANGPGSGFWQ